MIRRLTLADTIALIGLRGAQWVVRKGRPAEAGLGMPDALVDGFPSFSPAAFVWDRPPLRRSECVWVAVEGWRIYGLASARRRAGPTSWGVEHMVTVPGHDERCADLLEAVGSFAGQRGAEHVFLRLPDEWQLINKVQRSGFFPCAQVHAFTVTGRALLLGSIPVQECRARLPGDEHALFRLYAATTPAEVRAGIGLTLQQWMDAQEPEEKLTRELVLEQNGDINAWVRLAPHRRGIRVQMMVHPGWEGELRSLVALVLDQAGPRPVVWEVPEYQEGLRLTLERAGFQISNSYRLTVKSLAASVRKPAMAPVNA